MVVTLTKQQVAQIVGYAGAILPRKISIPALAHALFAPPRATEEQKRIVKEARKSHNMSTVGREEPARLRTAIDRLPGGRERPLVMAADGGFANRSFLGGIPERTTVVVRVRKDARLREALPPEGRSGNRRYGLHLPTPEEMLADSAIPTRTMRVNLGGRVRKLKCKVVGNVCWQRTTRDRPGILVLLKPLGYRLRKGDRLLYRQPGCLFVAGDQARLADIIEAYLLRWEIEVNFRDEKSILGAGKAQVWNERSVQRAPAFLVACYAALLLGSMAALGDRRDDQFDPLPPWRRHEATRPSARDLVRLLRKQVLEDRERRNDAA